ncbi:MAG: AAA family ATPase [Lachnospiraceae bacterium]|nr:AAA family ATPase [Lachnospiraceae bacterium]
MNNLNIPVGVSDFSKLRNQNLYYIDKTGLIAELISHNAEVTLVTRPRRFGKTLGMSMLENFFDIRRDSKKLFEGLEISEHKTLCDKWMNQYPVISVSFRRIDALNFTDAYQRLYAEIAALYRENAYILNSQNISEDEKAIFRQIRDRKAEKADVLQALQFLTQLLSRYYNKKVILLIDEYDVPVSKASNNGYYAEMLDVMKGIMQALKDNEALCLAVVTGCMKIAKESIFTGTNNFVSDTITHSGLNEYFGFVQSEVDKLLEDADLTNQADMLKKWYDGYHFGDYDVYCPWDVMSYIRGLKNGSTTKPLCYWNNSSDNAIIRSFIDYAGSNITKKLEDLMAGEYIVQHIDDNLTYDYLHSSEDNLWSVLYLTGYLTQVREADLKEKLPEGMTALMIPNAEIKELYEVTVVTWFRDSTLEWNRKALFDAVWSGDSEVLTQEMSKLLRRTISYHDYREDYYHAFLAGIFAGAGYTVESNKEHGEGRSDVVVSDGVNARVAVFEAKYTKKLENLEGDCDRALKQINDQMYAKEYEDDYDQILCYGISFFKKRCMVKKKKYTKIEN